MKSYFVYIISNNSKTLYIRMTNDLKRRIYEHKNKLIEGFSKKYNLNKLVFYEQTSDVKAAIAREKQLKNWHRKWKLNLIENYNPNWEDLSEKL